MKLMSLRLELASPDPLGQGWRMFLVRLPSPVKGPSAGFSARFQRVERGRRVPFCRFQWTPTDSADLLTHFLAVNFLQFLLSKLNLQALLTRGLGELTKVVEEMHMKGVVSMYGPVFCDCFMWWPLLKKEFCFSPGRCILLGFHLPCSCIPSLHQDEILTFQFSE